MTEAVVPQTQNEDGPFIPVWGWVAGATVVAVVVTVWAVLTFVAYPIPGTPDTAASTFPPDAAAAVAARGQFGDMFGLANALFSGFAFTALIVSLGMQRRELALQREELRMTRAELANQAQALADQAITMKQQAMTELLAAQINAQSTLLNVYQSGLGNSTIAAVLANSGVAPISDFKKALLDLKSQLGQAKDMQA